MHYKILALRKNTLGGGTFHRLFLPLSKMDAHFTDQLTEELVSRYDSLWIHYKCDIHPTQLSLWRLKYGFQIVLDIDDTWTIPINHPSYEAVSKSAHWSKQFAIIADYVVCSTPQVEEMVKPYNENTIVVPNRIPYGEGQYHVRQESLESFMSRKIRVGFCGSISHMEDWMSIHGKLRRVLSDGEFKQKCEFVLCGVPDVERIKPPQFKERVELEVKKRGEHMRQRIEKVLSDSFKKHNQEVWNKIAGTTKPIIKYSRPPEDYIDLYREIDILLCPLVDNDLNRKKSSLKLWEAACTDTYCIVSSLYKDKDLDIYPVENWYENIKSLIKDKEKFFHLKNSTSQYVRGLSDYHQECVLPRQDVLGKRRSIDLDIHGITYKEDQLTEYKPYLNTVNSISQRSYLFENNVLLNLYQ